MLGNGKHFTHQNKNIFKDVLLVLLPYQQVRGAGWCSRYTLRSVPKQCQR